MNEEIEAAVRNGREVTHQYLGDTPAIRLTNLMVDLMHFADATHGVSWTRCIEAARRQHLKEVGQAADERPLPAK